MTSTPQLALGGAGYGNPSLFRDLRTRTDGQMYTLLPARKTRARSVLHDALTCCRKLSMRAEQDDAKAGSFRSSSNCPAGPKNNSTVRLEDLVDGFDFFFGAFCQGMLGL